MDHYLSVKRLLLHMEINVQAQITYYQLKALEDTQVDFLSVNLLKH